MAEGKWSCDTVQIRDFATDKHNNVDGTPAGGGAGMVLKADVLGGAVDHVIQRQANSVYADSTEAGGLSSSSEAVGHKNAEGAGGSAAHPTIPILAMTPRGKPITQTRIRAIASGPGVTILCGRFEGFDERIFEARPQIEQVSLADIVLSGGEVAALALLDACIRLLPGVMGAASSGTEESFEDGLLEYPHYTRPQSWEGRMIPEVLRSGDHAKVDAWRKSQALAITRLRRPDLWERYSNARDQSASGARQKKKDQGK
jgi:tRNA (guanine37-N1)-methyltransferase